MPAGPDCRIAIPIHNRHGELVAYAGRSLEDGGYRYPPNFRKELELYNLHRAAAALQRPDEGTVIVPDLFDVFRLYEAGYEAAGGRFADLSPVSGKECGPGPMDCSPTRMIAVSVANNPVLGSRIVAVNVVLKSR